MTTPTIAASTITKIFHPAQPVAQYQAMWECEWVILKFKWARMHFEVMAK